MELVTLGASICDRGTGGGECVCANLAGADSQHFDHHLFAVISDFCAVPFACEIYTAELYRLGIDYFPFHSPADFPAGSGDCTECRASVAHSRNGLIQRMAKLCTVDSRLGSCTEQLQLQRLRFIPDRNHADF